MDLWKYKFELIQTAVVIAAYILIKYIAQKAIERVSLKFGYQKARVKIIKKLVNVFIFFVALTMIALVWGIDQHQLIYVVSSLLTILGIAFFAQWSIISNITATFIIFFNHPVKIGDNVTVVDKDMPVEGKISDIGVFFIILKTEDGSKLTIPSNVFIQKIVKWKPIDKK